MKLDTAAELWKGFTDVPIALLAVVLGVLLRKKSWKALFFLIAGTALCGTAIHVIVFPEPLFSVLWTGLFGLLFAAVGLFSHLLTEYLRGREEPLQKPLLLCGVLLWIAAGILRFTHPGTDIYLLVPYAVGLLAWVLAEFLRLPVKPRLMKALLPLLLGVLLVQALKDVIPFGVVIVHALIAAALLVVFRMGRQTETPR